MNATQCNGTAATVSCEVDVDAADVSPVHYHSLDYRLVGTLFVGVIFVVGLTGNALVVAVVVRVPEMRSPTNWYLVSLALADIVLLVSAPLPTLVEYHVEVRVLPARRYASAATIHGSVSVSVCLSVCLSQAGVLAKTTNGMICFFEWRLLSTL